MVTDANVELLTTGVITVTGRLVDASNATLFASIEHDGVQGQCIYKPIAGERPLWDFPDGQLAHREYAAFLISEFLSLNIVPPTVLRDGPFGIGMVQLWIDIDEEINLAHYFSQDDPQLRMMALFDAIINNTDRKIGHLLPDQSGHLYGCDHGVTFHSEYKLRTVLWQWAGEPLSESEIALLQSAISRFSEIVLALKDYLTSEEIEALKIRIIGLIDSATFPLPNPDWPSIPWPAF
ncbi:MAG: SCO1664 family protein [Actinobacteria bacterium]|nr:SCO1664 family protein [Actinomycetota bacterium]